jgi:hypothetical protein
MVLCWGFNRIQHFLSPSVVVVKALSSTKRSLTVSIAQRLKRERGGGREGKFQAGMGLPRSALLNPLSQWLWGFENSTVKCQILQERVYLLKIHG